MRKITRRRSYISLLASASLAGIPVATPTPAKAQAFSSVVDVCTGISLPRSEVTEVVGDVVTPIVTPIQGTVNSLLGVVDLLTLNLLPAPLNIDVTSILDDAAAGDPLSVQLLDNNGTVVGASDDCNLASDGLTLNDQAGISIGGNAITGLGTNGQFATAAELDAIAFGNGASTAAGATGAIALGTNASATAANGVALGAGSVANRGALTGYVAPGLSGTYNSIGSVSVGSTGNLRQITNVAPGTAATDAATVGQVQGALDAIAALDDIAVQYDDATQASVTFGGTSGTKLTNVAAGTLGASSTDAVNGSQLYATNQTVASHTTSIAANTAGIAALEDAAIKYDDATHASATLDGTGGTTLSGVAAGMLGATSTDAVNGSQLYATNQNVASNAAAIAGLQTSVAANTSSITSLQTNVTNLQTGVAANTADIAALNASAVQYDDATLASVTLGGASGTTLTNVAAGALTASSTDAVNGSQLYATNQAVTGNTTSIAANTGAIAGLQTNVTNLQTGVAANTADIANLETGVAANTADIAALDASAVQYDDASHASVTFDGASGTTLSNVAAGAIAATSTDAVNGSQLFATNQAVAANTANIASLQASVAGNTATIASLQTEVAGNTANIAGLQTSVAANSADIATLQTGLAGVTADISGLQADVAANTADIAANTADIAALENSAVQYDDASHASITLGGAAGTTISNVAAGSVSAGSTEAINGSQLFATNQGVAANAAAIASLDGRVTTNESAIAGLQTDVTTLDSRVTQNEADIASLDGRVTTNETNIANLDGRVTVNETEIASLDGRVTVNEGDIAALETSLTNIDGRVTTNETEIASLTTNVSNIDARVTANASNITALEAQVANVPVHFVSDTNRAARSSVPTNTVAVASASGGAATLTNVAAGAVTATSTDAVNGSQLYATNQRVDRNTADIQTIANNLAGSTVVAVQYSDPEAPDVSNGGTVTNDVALVGANSAAPVALHNVARGSLPNDAVNVGQFEAGLSGVLADSVTYTDNRVAELAFNLENLGSEVQQFRNEAFAGTASAMAVAGIPQTMEAGGHMIGGAVGYYRGEAAFAVGASATFNDGSGVAKFGATLDGRGHGGFSAGAGFSF